MKRTQFSLRNLLILIAILAFVMASWKYHEPALTLAGAQGIALLTLLRFAH
jgi:hypothetical protein